MDGWIHVLDANSCSHTNPSSPLVLVVSIILRSESAGRCTESKLSVMVNHDTQDKTTPALQPVLTGSMFHLVGCVVLFLWYTLKMAKPLGFPNHIPLDSDARLCLQTDGTRACNLFARPFVFCHWAVL